MSLGIHVIENTPSEGVIEQGNEKEEDQAMRLDQLPETTPKCRSSHNPNMEMQESEIGVSSVHKSRVSCDGDEDCQMILCLDGGGMKVNNKLSCMRTCMYVVCTACCIVVLQSL